MTKPILDADDTDAFVPLYCIYARKNTSNRFKDDHLLKFREVNLCVCACGCVCVCVYDGGREGGREARWEVTEKERKREREKERKREREKERKSQDVRNSFLSAKICQTRHVAIVTPDFLLN
jgi:hypothetical protein